MPEARKPRFRRQESWRLDRVPESWRRPRGVTSRVRKEKKGWPPRVKVGRGFPAEARGLHPSGYREKYVSNMSDLTGLDAKTQIVRLSGRLGERKRLAILEKARQMNLKVVNPGKVGTPEAGVPEVEETAAGEPEAVEGQAGDEVVSEESLPGEDEGS